MANLKPLPSMPSGRRSSVAASPCECGCGELVAGRFAAGHDARLAGFVKRVLRGYLDIATIRKSFSAGEATAVEKAIRERKLAHIKWADELAAMKAREAKERKAAKAEQPEQPTGTDPVTE